MAVDVDVTTVLLRLQGLYKWLVFDLDFGIPATSIRQLLGQCAHGSRRAEVAGLDGNT